MYDLVGLSSRRWLRRMEIRLVASSGGVSIYWLDDARISFFNSPYPAHHSFTAVDLYPRRSFGEVSPSPVVGEVTEIRRIMCPRGRYFESSSFDYVILIRSLENSDRLIKILHVAPIVEVGQTVKPGQDLGVLLRSGYFNFWTEPHIHVEVRKTSDPLRARGGLKIERSAKIDEAEPVSELKGTVVEVKPEYSLISLDDPFKDGITAEVGSIIGFLDAGLPHYGWIGIHAHDALPIGEAAKLCGKKIGTVKTAYQNMGLAKCGDFSVIVRNSQVGLSLYLHLSPNPLVKVVPPRPGALRIKKFEEVSIEIV